MREGCQRTRHWSRTLKDISIVEKTEQRKEAPWVVVGRKSRGPMFTDLSGCVWEGMGR